MKERDPAVTDPTAGLLVDQPEPPGPALLEHLCDVRAAVGGVMEPRPPLGEKTPDRSVVAERLEQLDVGLADTQQRCLDALLGDRLAMLQRHPEALRIELDRRVQILDRDAEVVNCLEHGEPV